MRSSPKSSRGFTLLELMISMAVGLIMIAAAVQLYSSGVDATWVISQKAEMQQDLRSTSDMLLKDISLAGAGMPLGQGIALPSGAGVRPLYGYANGCSNCVNTNGLQYPCAAPTGTCVPTLFGIIPGYQLGITPPGSTTRSDVITMVYTDTVFALNCYNISFPAGGGINPVTFTLPSPLPSSCVLPPNIVTPQPVNDPVVGLQTGDVVFFQNTLGSSSGQAVAEVSTVAKTGTNTYTVTFADSDPLKLNQSTATSGDLAQIITGTGTTATRLFVITYYLWLQPDPLGVGTGTPVLMRQVNGHAPTPVAENVVNMQFTYDTYAADGTLLNNSGDGGESTGVSPNLIRKINVLHLSIRSQLAGTRSALYATKGFQTYDIQTSISARNLSYQNRYQLQ